MSKQDRDKITPEAVWQEYQRGVDFNTNRQLYSRVKKAENFYNGRQWEGLKAPDLEQPVLNFLKRVVTYFMAMIISDDIGINLRSFSRTSDAALRDDLMAAQVDRVIERTKIKALSRDILRDAAVDGAGYLYLSFNPAIETGQVAQGEIESETVDCTNVIFGNPYDESVQRQPYIIIVQRRQVKTLRDAARRAGVKEWENIIPDNANAGISGYDENEFSYADMATVLVRLWKDPDSGTIHFSKSTQTVLLQADTDLGIRLYPISAFNWERIKNCYHGQAAITDGVIQNQIFVNTMWALFMIQAKKGTFPTVFYDATKIATWVNKPGGAIAVQGSPDSNAVVNYKPADFSAQAIEIVQKTIDYTKEFMGASDAALGNVKPENTSAIIATQKATAAPLELQRLRFYQFVEDYVRIIIDMICTNYGRRQITAELDEGNVTTEIDFGAFNYNAMDINVDVGSAAYWSEVMQIQTADNLFSSGIITDAVDYLESIPDTYIKNKAKLIESIKDMQKQQELQQMQVQGFGMPVDAPDYAAMAEQASV